MSELELRAPGSGPRRRRKQPERTEQQQIRSLLIHLGAKVYTIGTVRKKDDHQGTMQSKGLPDLLAFLPYEHGERRRGERLLVVEVKVPPNTTTAEQNEFALHCHDAGLAYVAGPFAAVVRWALAEGLLEGDETQWRIPRRVLMADGA